MTAAHCLDDRFPEMSFRVAVGCSNRGIDGVGSDREDSVNITGAVLVSGYSKWVAPKIYKRVNLLTNISMRLQYAVGFTNQSH